MAESGQSATRSCASSFQRLDIGNDVFDRFIAVQGHRHDPHLPSGLVIVVRPAQTGLEIL